MVGLHRSRNLAYNNMLVLNEIFEKEYDVPSDATDAVVGNAVTVAADIAAPSKYIDVFPPKFSNY